jgi:anti-sigma-K factor RskA
MDIKAYIESGILEEYIIGALSDGEMLEVEQLANEFPEIRTELSLIEVTFAVLGQKLTKPSSLSKDDVIAHVKKNSPNFQAGEDLSTTKQKSAENIQVKPKNNTSWGIISSIALIGLAALAGFLFMRSSTFSSQLESKEAELLQVKQNCGEVEKRNKNLEFKTNLFLNPDFTPIRMSGTPLSPNSFATVFYNKSGGTIHVDVSNLPTPIAGKQYQLWGIKDGKPVDMGVFDLNNNGEVLSKQFVAGVQAFAVTLEPLGGVVSPTMEQMYVIGEVI